jgi:radical SAM-linked protein
MRIRITFSKQGALRYTGHLDLQKIWERTARRARLKLVYSEGFHPQPKIQLASALPLGFSSQAEVADLWINSEPDLAILPAHIQANAPPGLKIVKVEPVDDRAPALQTQVTTADYEVTLLDETDEASLTRRLSALMDAPSLLRERRGKPYDLRPLIEDLSLGKAPDGNLQLKMRLSARESATGRPDEVLDELGIPIETARVERTCLSFKSN